MGAGPAPPVKKMASPALLPRTGASLVCPMDISGMPAVGEADLGWSRVPPCRCDDVPGRLACVVDGLPRDPLHDVDRMAGPVVGDVPGLREDGCVAGSLDR